MKKLDVCIIMKNESANIERCLMCLVKKGFGDGGKLGKIIVVDTGSTDDSVSIAKRYVKDVYEYVWKDDFADAKNYAVGCADAEYVMVVDADEYLLEFDENEFDEFTKYNSDKIGQVSRNNLIEADGIIASQKDWTERIYNKELYFFTGRIHEQLVPIGHSTNLTEDKYVKINVNFEHSGYLLSREELGKKALRNRQLLEEEMRIDSTPYLHFQMAQSYMLERDTKHALEWYDKTLAFDLNPADEYVQMTVIGYGECLLDNGMEEKALDLAGVYDDFSFSPDYVFLMGQIYLNNNMPIEAYKEFAKCLTMDKRNARGDGVTDVYPLHNIGVINEMLGDKESARLFYSKAANLGYARSKARLEEI